MQIEAFRATFEVLQTHTRGTIILPGDDNYHAARQVWNGMIDKYPAFIVRCTCSEDVRIAILSAQHHHIPIAIRGGGHSASGSSICNQGIVIDLSAMQAIQIDPLMRTIRAEAGLTIGQVIRATQAYGLGLTIGTVSGTGIAGLTLGGGIGWLMGKHGLTVDHLLEAQLITADGRILTVNANKDADLFWAIRGGGGNFGVVTSLTFRLFPLGQVLAGLVLYPLEQANAVFDMYRRVTQAAPDELTVYAAFVCPPDEPPAVGMALCYCGTDLQEGARIIAPLRTCGQPLLDTIHAQSYAQTSTMLDAGAQDGWRYYQKGGNIMLSDAAIETILQYATARTSPLSQILIQHIHGAASRVSPTAMGTSELRSDHYNLLIVATWTDGHDDAIHRNWAQTFWQQMQPFATGGGYINFLGNDAQKSIARAYGENYERLIALKTRYDPHNIFHQNYNISPAVPLSTSKQEPIYTRKDLQT